MYFCADFIIPNSVINSFVHTVYIMTISILATQLFNDIHFDIVNFNSVFHNVHIS